MDFPSVVDVHKQGWRGLGPLWPEGEENPFIKGEPVALRGGADGRAACCAQGTAEGLGLHPAGDHCWGIKSPAELSPVHLMGRDPLKLS